MRALGGDGRSGRGGEPGNGARCASLLGELDLEEVVRGLGAPGQAPGGIAIRGVAGAVEAVQPGDLFVALDGADVAIRSAVKKGAVAVVCDRRARSATEVPVVVVQDVLRALGHLVDRVAGRPSSALFVLGVLRGRHEGALARGVRAALSANRGPCALLRPARLGGPGSLELQRALGEARAAGSRAAVVDLVPRDLPDGRLEGLRLSGAVLYGICPSHAAGFRSPEAMLEACLDVVRGIPADSPVYVDDEDPFSEIVRSESRGQVLGVGTGRGAEVRWRIQRRDLDQTILAVEMPTGAFEVRAGALSDEAVFRRTVALAIAARMGADPGSASAAARQEKRNGLERLGVPLPWRIFVDRRASSRSIQETLRMLRPLASGRVVTLLRPPDGGSARLSVWKRAAAAEALSDLVVVAGEEGEEEGSSLLFRGFEHPERAGFFASRREAVSATLGSLRPNDVLFVPGAGEPDRQAILDWFLSGLTEGMAG